MHRTELMRSSFTTFSLLLERRISGDKEIIIQVKKIYSKSTCDIKHICAALKNANKISVGRRNILAHRRHGGGDLNLPPPCCSPEGYICSAELVFSFWEIHWISPEENAISEKVFSSLRTAAVKEVLFMLQ